MNRYEEWAKQAGLAVDSFTQFEDIHKEKVATIAIIIDLLAHICDLATSHRNLVKYYGLKLENKAAELDDDAATQEVALLAQGARTLWSEDERKKREENLLEFQKRLGNIQKIKWGIKDKAKFDGLVSKISNLNDGLRDILPIVQQKIYDRSLLIALPSNPKMLDALASEDLENLRYVSQTYARAAKIKSKLVKQAQSLPSRDYLSLSDEATELDSVKIAIQEGELDRVIGKMDDKKIIVEFKEITDQDHSEIFENRLKSLVALLQISPKPDNYRVLDCQGYFIPRSDRRRIGMVFSFPETLAMSEHTRMDTLYSLLRGKNNNEVPVQFPLGERLRLAAVLASSIAELHAAGWLHRNITSNNVLCLGSEAVPAISRPFLSGFEFARFNDPREVSEVMQNTGDNNYRHPEYQVPVPKGRKYRRSYELYSLGVLLIEIGLWKQIKVFRQEDQHSAGFSQYLRDRIVPYLSYYMGQHYRDAVLYCLDTARFGVGDDEGKALLEAFSQKVVSALEMCRA